MYVYPIMFAKLCVCRIGVWCDDPRTMGAYVCWVTYTALYNLVRLRYVRHLHRYSYKSNEDYLDDASLRRHRLHK